MEEDEGSLVGLNDVNSNIVPKQSCFSKQKNIIIVAGLLVLFFVVLIIVIILIPKSSGNESGSEEEPVPPPIDGEIVGKIECIHDVQSVNDYTLILSDNYEKNDLFDLQIGGKSVKYSKNYKFGKSGENNVTFVLYGDINMEYMFKDLPTLKTVKMTSEKNAKITSLKGAFEKCTNLEELIYLN